MKETTPFVNNLHAPKELIELGDIILHLFRQGYSIEEIIALLDDGKKHNFDLKIMVTHFHKVFHDQAAQKYNGAIAANNNACNDYYARKKLWLKVKEFYIILKIVVVILLVIFVYYNFDRIIAYLKALFQFLDAAFISHSRFGLYNDVPTPESKGPEDTLQQPVTRQLVTPTQQSNQSAPEEKRATIPPVQAHPKESLIIQSIISQDVSITACQNKPQGSFKITSQSLPNSKLQERLAQQADVLKSSGLEPTKLDLDPYQDTQNVARRGHRKFDELLTEVVEKMNKSGINPIIVPQ